MDKKMAVKKKPAPPPAPAPEELCPDNPCLILLRKAAIAEREDILFYLEAAAAVCGELRALFLEAAADEMRHFVMTMRHIAALDPVQAEYLEEEGLDVLLPRRGMQPKWAMGWHPSCHCPHPVMEEEEEDEEEVMVDEFPPEHDMEAICLLTKALVRELEGTNMYQDFMEESCDPMCCHHFCHLMNEEKRHVAAWIAALYDLTDEPPSMEREDD